MEKVSKLCMIIFLQFSLFNAMQPKKTANTQITVRKQSASRAGNQPQMPQNSQNAQNISNGNNNNNINNANSNNMISIKQRQQAIASIVREYLQKCGYQRSFQTFKNQKPAKRIIPTALAGKQIGSGFGSNQEKNVINLFEKGNREEFFKQTQKIFAINSSNTEQHTQFLRKLQFQLNIYFCIYSIHPCTESIPKKTQVDKISAQSFKRYIDLKGQQVSQQSELLTFFALPYIPKPQQNPSMAKVFTKEWIQKLKANLQQILRQFVGKNTANSNKQNKKNSYQTSLHQIYDRYLDTHVGGSTNQSRVKSEESKQIDHKIIEKYQRENQELRIHNKEMVSYLDILQQNLKDLNQASKVNLVQSNRKWFQFSKEILQLTKKALKGENVKDRLQTYQRFFGTNLDQLIYCTDQLSLFEKNSYTEDASMIPGSKNANNPDRITNSQSTQLTPIDISKICSLFAKADKPENQLQICLVLKALKQRLCFHKNAYTKRQVVVSYQRNDLCALKDSNYHVQKKLLIDSPQKVKQFYLRLMNYISTDDLGNQYLSSSDKLVQNLIHIMDTTSEQTPYRKHAIGILQKLSYIKNSQLKMISFGIIPIIFKILKTDSLNETTIQYLMGLIMNLAVRKQSILNFQKHKSQILPILLNYINIDDNQIKGYVNGTLYVLFQLKSIKKQALQKYSIKQILTSLLEKSNKRIAQLDPQQAQGENCIIRQYSYILERLEENGEDGYGYGEEEEGDEGEGDGEAYGGQGGYGDGFEDEEDDDEFVDEIQDGEVFSDGESNSSQYIEGEDGEINGEELLMKKYALLGPEAVRQEIINRSILDQTSRKSNNMTTSINHSKRIDKVFHKTQRPQTPSLLPGSLDLSITPNR